MILLTPGPCMTSETVRQAAAMPDMNHRDPAFIDLLKDTKRRLLRVYPQLVEGEFGWPERLSGEALGSGNTWKPYLIGGSGTAAVEAMITSCIKTGPVLLIDSGYYSGRMRSKLDAHGIPYDVLKTENWLTPFEPFVLDEKLYSKSGGPAYEAVVTTHNETTTGALQNLERIGFYCNVANTKLLVDAMSSFGADDIDFTHIDAVACSANKCLHGLPGLSFVLVRDWLAEEMKTYDPRTVYLSLPFYEGDSPPLTPPVPILSALHQALVEMGQEGAVGRREAYRRRAKILRQGLNERGFRFAIPEADMSCTLTTASIPEGWTSERWLKANMDAGFMVYGTKGKLTEKWFQVANMGELSDAQLHLWLAVVDDILAY